MLPKSLSAVKKKVINFFHQKKIDYFFLQIIIGNK